MDAYGKSPIISITEVPVSPVQVESSANPPLTNGVIKTEGKDFSVEVLASSSDDSFPGTENMRLPDPVLELGDFVVSITPPNPDESQRVDQAASSIVQPQTDVSNDLNASLLPGASSSNSDENEVGVEGGIELQLDRLSNANEDQPISLQAGGHYKIEEMGVDTEITIPPQKMLLEAINQAKTVPGFQNATVKIKSSIDQQLSNEEKTNTPPNYKVERYINDRGVELFKVTVDYAVELKSTEDPSKTIRLTLSREFYSNAKNENEALLAVYHVSKSIQAGTISEDAKSEVTDFNIAFHRDSESHQVIGIKSVMNGNIDITSAKIGEKKKYRREINVDGSIQLQRGRGGEITELTKEARLLNAQINIASPLSILERLSKAPGGVDKYFQAQEGGINTLQRTSRLLQAEIEQHELVKVLKGLNDKKMESLFESLKKGKLRKEGCLKLGLSADMADYLIKKQALILARQAGNDSEIEEGAYIEARKEVFKELTTLFKQLDQLQGSQKRLLLIKHELEELKTNLHLQNAEAETIRSRQAKIDSLLDEVNHGIQKNTEMLTLQKRLGRLMEREATPLIDAASISQEPLESSDEAPNSTVQASTIPEVVVTLAEHN